MSKQMEKAAMTAYQRARRAKKKAAALAAVNPPCQSPVKPAAVPCTGCEQLRAEVSRLASALATMVDQQQTDRPGVQPTSRPQHSDRLTEKMTDSDALCQRLNADKVNRINNYGKNPSIGRVAPV